MRVVLCMIRKFGVVIRHGRWVVVRV
jgi:hypothetical protein